MLLNRMCNCCACQCCGVVRHTCGYYQNGCWCYRPKSCCCQVHCCHRCLVPHTCPCKTCQCEICRPKISWGTITVSGQLTPNGCTGTTTSAKVPFTFTSHLHANCSCAACKP